MRQRTARPRGPVNRLPERVLGPVEDHRASPLRPEPRGRAQPARARPEEPPGEAAHAEGRRPGPRDEQARRSRTTAGRRWASSGAKTTETIGWAAYTEALGRADVKLLVLMPHTDYTGTPMMEIDGEPLERSFIEPEYVTGDRDVDPIVVLFGCATSGNPDDPAGFASRFCEKGAAVVFHSSAQLLNTHAVQLSQRLVTLLDTGGRSRPLPDSSRVPLAERSGTACSRPLPSTRSATPTGGSDVFTIELLPAQRGDCLWLRSETSPNRSTSSLTPARARRSTVLCPSSSGGSRACGAGRTASSS